MINLQTFAHLSAAGTSVIIGYRNGEAEIIHWGADLGDAIPGLEVLEDMVPPSAIDVPVTAGVLPQASSGWRGRPGLRGQRIVNGLPGYDFSPRLRLTAVDQAGNSLAITQTDPDASLTVRTSLVLHPGGLLEMSHRVTNDGSDPFQLDELAVVLPVPAIAKESLDLTGRWCRERHPQRGRVRQGTWVRSGRHGRTGHDASLLFAAGTPGFTNRTGKVWAVHFAWSGNHEQFTDTLADGRSMIGGSELLGPGEIILSPGQSYCTPTLFSAYSDRGLDGISEAFYAWFRNRPHHITATNSRSQGKQRPVVLNTWEAVYFDHDLTTLNELIESAADLGVERFVLDDGWFRGRRNDKMGLGDWFVDENVWPNGLTPLIQAVEKHGMDFGIWVEPEMVSIDSDVARSHPDWLVRPSAKTHKEGGRLPLEWRAQHVIDLVNTEAWQYVFDRMDSLLKENRISYLKWDQNRDHQEHGHAGRPSVHAQTLAAYRLLDELRKAHPHVEIESCSSGGARIDLAILERTDRVWTSDCNDALERQTIQRWTGVVVPPELLGAHIGPDTSHTTGRTHSLSFRGITALFGHFGLEWDIRKVEGRSREELRRLISIFKQHRDLLHSGKMVRADMADESLLLHGVVSHTDVPTGDVAALFALIRTTTGYAELPGRVTVPGLNPDRSYHMQLLLPDGDLGDLKDVCTQITPPLWVVDGAVASGRFLSEVGLPMPNLNPEQGLLIQASAL
ncbi:alpha-galactosidase [Paenarthrobacter sp. NPDC092416]|uniref:alpha-galactosidase n=1 Tax=Paenarthrobacter sp. NPDC092416 TaxID=3364386 RepID=UPI00382E5E2E